MVRGLTISLNPIEAITLESHDTEIQLNACPEIGDTSFGIKTDRADMAPLVNCIYGRLIDHPTDEGLQISVFDLEDARQVERTMASLQYSTWRHSRKQIAKRVLDMQANFDD